MSKDKPNSIIPTRLFVKNFPEWLKSKAEESSSYHHVHTLTYRTFRWYVTNNLMPKPIIINKKSFYKNTSEMYKRLSIVKYHINVHRYSIKDVKKIISSIHPDELDLTIKLLPKKYFFDSLISTGNIKKSFKKTWNRYIETDSDRRLMVKLIGELLLKESESLNYLFEKYKVDILCTNSFEADTFTDELRKRTKMYADFKKQIEKTLDNIKTIQRKTRYI